MWRSKRKALVPSNMLCTTGWINRRHHLPCPTHNMPSMVFEPCQCIASIRSTGWGCLPDVVVQVAVKQMGFWESDQKWSGKLFFSLPLWDRGLTVNGFFFFFLSLWMMYHQWPSSLLLKPHHPWRGLLWFARANMNKASVGALARSLGFV